jgi:cytidylate kinase
VVIVGRAANIVTSKLPDVLHVRLTGSLEHRTERLMASQGLTRKAALAYIEREDTGRRRYLKKYFGVKNDAPLLYHLVINTDHFTLEQTTDLIERTVAG